MFALRLNLGVEVRDEVLCVRDLYDLLDWDSSCPDDQEMKLSDGFYELTLGTNVPDSGILGDNQKVSIYLKAVASMPVLQHEGIPILCE